MLRLLGYKWIVLDHIYNIEVEKFNTTIYMILNSNDTQHTRIILIKLYIYIGDT